MINLKKMKPTKDENSECFECNAGMCDICSLKTNWDTFEFNEPLDIQIEEPNIKCQTKKEILSCYMCGWEHHEPNHHLSFRKATNGTFQKTCGNCGRLSLLEKDILVDVE